ncbi:TPA: SGNH hydrolase domain-containing protein, partial [Vibrio diabolicus]
EISTFNKIESSPERQRCHTGGLEYLDPKLACKFNNQEVQWAVIGDSHGVELSYSLASTLSQVGEGLVQYTFSGCIPSYERKNDFSVCSKWTNQVVKDILGNDSIKNVVVIYRYKSAFNDDKIYANLGKEESENKKINVSESFYKMVSTISHSGRKVFVISPFPDSKIGVSSRISASN